MGFRRVVVLVLTASALITGQALHAQAGDYHWSSTACFGTDTEHAGEWYGEPGKGAYYRSAQGGEYFITGNVHRAYAEAGYECGIGLLTHVGESRIQNSGSAGQYTVTPYSFIKPGDCTLYTISRVTYTELDKHGELSAARRDYPNALC